MGDPKRADKGNKAASLDPLRVVGQRWAPQIIVCLLERPLRFSDLKRALPNLSAKVLTARVRQLESEGFVTRGLQDSSMMARVYRLTPAAVSIGTALKRLSQEMGEKPDDAPSARFASAATPDHDKLAMALLGL